MKDYITQPVCNCGKKHEAAIDDIIIGHGVISRVPELVNKYGCRYPFILADVNTYHAAGEKVCGLLKVAGIGYKTYVFQNDLKPNEEAVGGVFMHYDKNCDMIIAVGSGVINDIGKILSNVTEKPYIIVATAPSMDGYASATSSVERDGLKVSLPSRAADVIIGDIDVLKQAPLPMLKAGLGDMLAKYISIAEWRIGSLITGEYYCEQIAQLIRSAVKKCVDNARGLLQREDSAVQAVFEGLVIGGVAMTYAGVSRPASGVEHYFSHIWDMRGLEFGMQTDLHGIQCAMATMLTVKLYEAIKKIVPEEERARAAVEAFDYTRWSEQLRGFLGKSGETMIAQELTERKYDKAAHSVRFRKILNNWEEICRIIEEELPTADELSQLMDTIGISKDLCAIGVDVECAKLTFQATKDIRDKYVLSRLAWDLGVLEEITMVLG